MHNDTCTHRIDLVDDSRNKINSKLKRNEISNDKMVVDQVKEEKAAQVFSDAMGAVLPKCIHMIRLLKM